MSKKNVDGVLSTPIRSYSSPTAHMSDSLENGATPS